MSKKLAIMQPYFFPYLGYWQMINAVDKFVIYDDVNFIKGGWINRNNTLINGCSHLFTLPLLEASPYKHINEIKVTNNKKQKQKLLKSFEMSYSKAPYKNKVIALLADVILQKEDNLHLFLKYQFEKVFEYLDIDTEILLSSNIEKTDDLHAQDRVIDICKRLSTTQYINAIGGQELYSKEDFAKNGIQLNFIKMNEIKYKQFSDKFVPNLSIIDVMMFNSPETIKEMLDDYELI